MAKVLILFAHPALERSRVHARLVTKAKNIPGVYLHDLYEAYPDFDIDIKREQSLLLKHDVVLFQHPFYWYSAPAIIKQWQDLVLQHGWAYGSEGRMLEGKAIANVLSSGGGAEAYRREGRNRFTIHELLAPFDQTAMLCHMRFMPPFVIQGTHRLHAADLEQYAVQYEMLLRNLVNDEISIDDWSKVTFLNELAPIINSIN